MKNYKPGKARIIILKPTTPMISGRWEFIRRQFALATKKYKVKDKNIKLKIPKFIYL